ncbi:uncharacterized protein LOC110276038 [Arachis duranensis]|uniref:Uncharacterized protein LOC110276038 n=1 Tax=Arachis duranensis TaxID=130453 RepID=A0A9C6TCX4_ARADU|nr:uncharacterized protein LOC110276038 [Arachis duranensis]
MEILKSNPGSTARIDVKPIPQSLPVFDKIYICFEGCKQGFKSGCRPFIHLDGAFLKTYHGCQLLSAVAQDANNQFYVVAFAVARSETKESWKWFLTLLQEDLGDASQFSWNFMSDQQKGLLLALKEVMPRAHHRNCVMHIWKNFINRFKDMYIRDIVWECARCTTEPEFKEKMDRLKGVNNAAWEYLMKFEPTTWVKAYFSHGPKVDNLTNNMCEVFNAKVVKYRVKPVLTMCEEIRCYLMRRMTKHIRLLEHHSGKLAPVQEKRLQMKIKPSSRWIAEWVGDNERKRFEVTRKKTKVNVDLIKHTCSCNTWQLTGMPCIHAIAAIRKRHDQVQDYLRPALPPIKRSIGQPKVHNRNKDPAEAHIQGEKMKRSFQVTCSKCNEKGHNYKTCKGAPSNPNWKPKKKKPKKTVDNSQAMVLFPLSQSAPQPEDQNQSQGETLGEPSAGEAAESAPVPTPFMAQSSAPAQTPFRPPSQLPRMDQPDSNAAAHTFRPKQPIVRPPTSVNPPPNPTPHTQKTPTSRGPSKETMKAATSATKRILKPQKK